MNDTASPHFPLFPSLEAARQAGLIPLCDLSPYQAPREEALPAGAAEHLLCYAPEALEELKSRKSWRREGRRIPPGTAPRREIQVNNTPQPLYALAQTVSEEEYHVYQKGRVTQLITAWQGEHEGLMARFTLWREGMTRGNPPEVEEEWRDLVELYQNLEERRRSLAASGREMGLELPELDGEAWYRAVETYRRQRFHGVMAEKGVRLSELAEQVDQELAEHERRQADPFYLMPYWKYFGQFHKVLEATRLEKEVAEATRIRDFHALFPAREMTRHFTLYLGPTNSGKTYQALQRLSRAETGVYLAPLRLLALEVAETLNQWGVHCDMITGEERIAVEGARHSARTVEMLPLHQSYDLCVIDEAQMLGDPDRGWAWTQAILGVKAAEVCVLGAPEARPVIEKLLRLTGDPFEVVELERLSPLSLMDRPVKEYREMTPGTAVIAFSRSGVLRLKSEIEQKTGQRAAVLYGALPPEVRRQQAQLFASGQAPYLASTDAIGMGLNLPIRTILFSQDSKMIDRREHPLTPMEVRQIAGRAGRYGKNEVGFIGTFRIAMHHIRRNFERAPPLIRRAHLAPNLDHLTAIAGVDEAEHHGKPASLARLLTLFLRTVRPDPEVYDLAQMEDQIQLARVTDRFRNLDLPTRFALSAAPVPLRALPAVDAYGLMVETVAKDGELPLEHALPDITSDGGRRLGMLETAMQVVNLYSWLHYRFPGNFPELEQAVHKRREINKEINEILTRAKRLDIRHCGTCGKELPTDHEFSLCDGCWQERRQKQGERVNWGPRVPTRQRGRARFGGRQRGKA